MKATFEKYRIPWVEPTPGSHVSHHVGTQDLDPLSERTNVFYAALPTREKYIKHLVERRYPRKGDEKRCYVLTRCAERSATTAPSVDEFPCCLPRSKVWLEWLDRYQLGTEKMMTQGFFPGQFIDARCGEAALADLAGNAIGMPVCMAINQAMMRAFLPALNRLS
jgi:hypothetical protein